MGESVYWRNTKTLMKKPELGMFEHQGMGIIIAWASEKYKWDHRKLHGIKEEVSYSSSQHSYIIHVEFHDGDLLQLFNMFGLVSF